MLRLVRVGKINAANRRWSATVAAASTPSPPPPSAVAIDAPVDEHCPTDVRAKAHVYKSARGVYDVTLNQTDVAFNKLGHNKFYVMQLLEANALAVDSTNYWLWSRWGRVGSTGQSSLQPGQSLPEMVTMFEQTFKKKTGNKFADRAKFVYKKGNYDMLEIAYEVKDDGGAAAAEAKAKAAAAAKVPSKLPAKVQSLVELIFDTKRMEETMVQLHFDTKKAPLGKLSKTQIKNGYEALKVIDDLVRAGNVKSNELKDANSVYYTRVPHNFGFRMPPLITTVDMVKAETDLLDALSEIEIAMTLISNKGNGDLNVFDKHYNQLNCDIQPLDPSSTEWDVIQKYLKQTHVHNSYKLEIEDVYVLGRKSESSRDNKHIHNHQLLWHGSRLTNFVGLLSQGLRIAPPEAPSTGYMFGKGVYFADMVSKSANYCVPTSYNGSTGLMLLCEVALGNCRELRSGDYNASNLPAGFHATKGMGGTIPDPKHFTKMFGDVHVPYGTPTKVGRSSSLMFNEYIVYDVSQVRMRYLLRVKFCN